MRSASTPCAAARWSGSTGHLLLWGEEVEIVHRALSRRTFADGALRAARFAANAQPGLYSMADVLEDF